MSRPIGYYVHHQGDGHRSRALAIARAAGDAVTLLGTGLAGRAGGIPCIDLADDRPARGGFEGRDDAERPSSLHYAPIDHEGLRQRVARLTGWIAQARPALLVVDVSVEVAMLARLASVPTVYVRLSGRRYDRPHMDAFRGAAGLLAPFHPDLDDERTPDAIRRRTFYAPGVSGAGIVSEAEDDVILAVVGRGGGSSDGARWAQVAATMPEARWRVIGPCTVPANVPSNLELRGWVDDADRMIASAGLVVGAAGDGLVGAVIANRRPFICLPEARPFDEQFSKARRLSALGAAVVCPAWPSSGQWHQLAARARALNPDNLARLDISDGARRAADWLRMLANETGWKRSHTR
jgi:hypothetical protein